MGVPGLSTQLMSFTSPLSITVPLSSQSIVGEIEATSQIPQSKSLVVDGPSFAYHVYGQCVAACRSTGAGAANFPTYREITETAIRFLQVFELFGLQLDSIFFDGILPMNKHQVRRERLQKSYFNVSRFKSHSPSGLVTQACFEQPVNLLQINKLRKPSTLATPPLPFLVPSILEALINHPKYSRATKVVPGEADIFCKRKTDELSSSLILTNDSDLVLLSPSCPVAFLNTLDFLPGKNTTTLRILTCSALQLTRQLNCPDLVKLGYQLSVNPGASLRQCASLAKSYQTENDRQYRNFRETYVPQTIEKLAWLPLQSKLKKTLEQLDPRISEIVIDVLFPVNSNAKACLFLAPLIEDTSKASPWRLSFHVRRLAYSILAHCSVGKTIKILEVDRRGPSSAEQIVELEPSSETHESLRSLFKSSSTLGLPENILETSKRSAESDWYWLALDQALHAFSSGSSKIPARQAFEALFSPTEGQQVRWDTLHLQAQLDGFLYSYRILKQILDIYFAVQEDGLANGTAELDAQTLSNVKAKLDTLPPISSLHIRPGEAIPIGGWALRLSARLDEIYGAQASSEPQTNKTAKRIARRKGKAASQPQAAAKKQALLNPYSVLAVDE